MEILRWITILSFMFIAVSGQLGIINTWNKKVLSSIQEKIGLERHMKVEDAKHKLLDWFVRQRKNETATGKWGPELPRIATALFLGNDSLFDPGNAIGDEIIYELIIELFPKLSQIDSMRNENLASYINALRVACLNPTDFFGVNLVLRLKLETEDNKYQNPFAILARCIGRDRMTFIDAFRQKEIFDIARRIFWTDTQSVAIMALQCMASASYEGFNQQIRDREKRLAEKQFQNGTIDNLVSTALLVQALINDLPAVENFNLSAALDFILQNQKEDGSFGSIRDSYFVLPVLNFKSLINLDTNHHCMKRLKSDEEPSKNGTETVNVDDEFMIHYTVMFKENFDQARTWRIMASRDNTLYDIIEMANKLDPRHNVKYRIIYGKPDILSLYGEEEDPEYGIYWFIYIRSALPKKEKPVLIEKSPVEVKMKPNEEVILWYRKAEWMGNPPETAF